MHKKKTTTTKRQNKNDLQCDDPIKSSKFPIIGNPSGPGNVLANSNICRRDNFQYTNHKVSAGTSRKQNKLLAAITPDADVTSAATVPAIFCR